MLEFQLLLLDDLCCSAFFSKNKALSLHKKGLQMKLFFFAELLSLFVIMFFIPCGFFVAIGGGGSNSEWTRNT